MHRSHLCEHNWRRNNFIEMDPRPYNYEFRRPRPSNPTYQSFNAYDSLYHMGKKQYLNSIGDLPSNSNHYPAIYNAYQHHSPDRFNPEPQQSRQQSPPRRSEGRYEETGVNTDKKESRSASNYSQRSKSSGLSNNPKPSTHRTSVLSNYGSNTFERRDPPEAANPVRAPYSRIDTSQIFQKQQKNFDIITMFSRQHEPLRRYPKLTQQHLLYEKGMDVVGLN